MDKTVMDYIVEKTKELIAAPSCSQETKAAAESWLSKAGTPEEKSETEKYIKELEMDIMPIDNLIAFAGSDRGKEYFGADIAAGIAAHAKEIKEKGAKYCDCPACLAASDILSKKEEMLK